MFLLYLWDSLVTLELISLIPWWAPFSWIPLAVKLLDNRLFIPIFLCYQKVTPSTFLLNSADDFKIEGYRTVIQKRNLLSDKVRILALIIDSNSFQISERDDLMSQNFPLIWLDIKNKLEMPYTVAGAYREWSPKGSKTEASQLESLTTLLNQIDTVSEKSEKVVVTGDTNLDSNKWLVAKFLHKNLSIPLLMMTLQSQELAQTES